MSGSASKVLGVTLALLIGVSCGGDDATAPPGTPPVTVVEVQIDSASLTVGHSTVAHAIAKDAAGDSLEVPNAGVSWQSSSPSIATVSSTGSVTTVSAGTATISATVENVTGSAPVTAIAPNAPQIDLGITVSANKTTPAPGDSVFYTVAVTNLGPVTAPSVIVGDTLPSALTAATNSTTTSGTFSSATGIWTVGSVGVGVTQTLTLRSVVPSSASVGTVTDRATASATGQTDSVSSNNIATSSISVVAPIGGSEPVFGAHSTVIYQDNMDGYASAKSMWANTAGGPMRIRQADFGQGLLNEDTLGLLLIPGRQGTGNALRMAYTGLNQDSHTWEVDNVPVIADTTTLFITYWARVTLTLPILSNTLAVKWFLLFHSDNTRNEYNTHDHIPCVAQPSPARSTYFQIFDQQTTACQANQPVGPYPIDVFDGNWHRFTYQYKPNTTAGSGTFTAGTGFATPGSRDGISRMWIDGTKVIDISAAAAGVTPTGGYKTWCGVDDVDGLSNHGVVLIRWGATMTTSSLTGIGPYTIDVDDFSWWKQGT